jgi:putative SOS response-associated peptidase YedK
VLTITEDDAGRHARMMRWGLIPHWAKEPLKASTINARAETITEKPMWREPFRKRRCIVPANGFYECEAEGTSGTMGRN